MTHTEYSNKFDAALDAARRADIAGAAELWLMYQSMFDDVTTHDEALSRLDSYQCDASQAAQELYMTITRSI